MIAVAMPGTCPFCDKPATVTVSSEEEAVAVVDWVEHRYERPLVQVAFPHLSLAQRETMISGAHSECFDAAFPEPEKEGPK